MMNRNLSSIAADLETELILRKQDGNFSPKERHWILKVIQEQFEIPVRKMIPGCTTMKTAVVGTHFVRDTVKILEEQIKSANLDPSLNDKLAEVLKEARHLIEFEGLWKRIDVVLFPKDYYCPEYHCGGCYMLVFIPVDPTADKKFLVINQFNSKEK